MPDRLPRFFMLVPGPWASTVELVDSLRLAGVAASRLSDAPGERGGVRVDVVAHAEGFGEELRWGRGGWLSDSTVDACAATGHAALVEFSMTLDEGYAAAASVGSVLREAGGIAVRMEGSGIASEWGPWMELMQLGTPGALVAAAVIFVNAGHDRFFSCGMHQFDLPDVELEGATAGTAVEWMQEFCVYSLAEAPVFCTGHTFSPDAVTPRRKLERWPDQHHAPSDGRHNSFGYWRALKPGQASLDVLSPELVPVPALVAVLLMKERAVGRALAREEVELLAERAPCIAMEPADARRLERARGYVDLEPRRAWDQWQLVRRWYT